MIVITKCQFSKKMNNYIEGTGKTYQSYYHKLIEWKEKDDGNKPVIKESFIDS